MTNTRLVAIGYVVLALAAGLFLEHVLLAAFGGFGSTQPLTRPLAGDWTWSTVVGFAIAAGRCYEPQQALPFYPVIEALTALYAQAPPAVQAAVTARWPGSARSSTIAWCMYPMAREAQFIPSPAALRQSSTSLGSTPRTTGLCVKSKGSLPATAAPWAVRAACIRFLNSPRGVPTGAPAARCRQWPRSTATPRRTSSRSCRCAAGCC